MLFMVELLQPPSWPDRVAFRPYLSRSSSRSLLSSMDSDSDYPSTSSFLLSLFFYVSLLPLFIPLVASSTSISSISSSCYGEMKYVRMLPSVCTVPSLLAFDPVLETDVNVFMRKWCPDDCGGFDDALSSIESYRLLAARSVFFLVFFSFFIYLLGLLLLVRNFNFGV